MDRNSQESSEGDFDVIPKIRWDDVDRAIVRTYHTAHGPHAGRMHAATRRYHQMHIRKTGHPPDGTPDQIAAEVEDTIQQATR